MKILLITEYFLPAYKAGGPINTIANLIKNLDEEFEVITTDRDLGDKKPFNNIETNIWTSYQGYKVLYLKKETFNIRILLKLIKSKEYDVVYLNSFFSIKFSIAVIFLRYFNLINNLILLAPKGEFSPGFLKQKYFKKEFYLYLSKKINLYSKVIWHASTELEKEHILKKFPEFDGKILIGEDITEKKDINLKLRIKKENNELRICFVSRIHKMKNLLGAIEILKLLPNNIIIDFNIYGPIHDIDYWKVSLKELNSLHPNIYWKYNGVVTQQQVYEIYKNHHLLFLPTLGENYGHVIIEALSAGCLVLISDKTPWNIINEYCFGKAISLNKIKEFIDFIIFLYEIDNNEFESLSKEAILFASQHMSNSSKIQQNRNLFKRVEEILNKNSVQNKYLK